VICQSIVGVKKKGNPVQRETNTVQFYMILIMAHRILDH